MYRTLKAVVCNNEYIRTTATAKGD